MDGNMLLGNFRRACALSQPNTAITAAVALDKYLSKGGQLPDAWKPAQGEY